MPRIKVYDWQANPAVDPPALRVAKWRADQEVAGGHWVWIDEQSAKRRPRTYSTPDQNKWARSQQLIESVSVPVSDGACEICGFARAIEKAHIIPERFNGLIVPWNILFLCPNHHTLFDRNLLTYDEFLKISARVHAALSVEHSHPLLQAWKDDLATKYGLSLPS